MSKGMPLLAGIAAIMIVSYTVFRLQYAANHLPYDPGEPFPAMDVPVEPPDQLPAKLHDAFLSRHSARLATSTGELATYEAWPLYGLERERAIRQLDDQITAARRMPAQQRNTDTCQHLAVLVAARKLIETEGVFVLEDEIENMHGHGDWQYWTTLLFETKQRRRILCVPIDRDAFGFVRDAATADPRTFDPR